MGATDLKGKTALVTGASSGLGAAFARDLAARGADLVVTARRADNLEALAKEIRERLGVKVEVVVLDLSEPGAPDKLWAATEGKGLRVDVLINNAGGGIHQNFVDTAWERTARMIQLNLVALTELTYRFAKVMLGRGGGHILNVSSVGAYAPSPTYAVYSATKAFVRDMSEAVAYELRGTPVRVCSLCPGVTQTEFHERAGHTLAGMVKATSMTAEACVAIGLDALFGGRRNIISGLINQISMWLLRFIPRRTIVWSAALSMGKPEEPPDP